MDYHTIKRQALERFFARANPMQREAIFQTDGAVLIIAGAGSGKTTVLCNRIANLILFGTAYKSSYTPLLSDEDMAFLQSYANGDIEPSPLTTAKLSDLIGYETAKPWSILAVTFTNKAAGELKERLSAMGANAEDVWACTFHSCCVKLLRRGIDRIGYKSGFTIYDMDDSLRVIKSSMEYLAITDKAFNPKVIQSNISRAKDKLISPEDFEAGNDYFAKAVKSVYIEYQKRLKAQNALDFDDIISKTVELLKTAPDILEKWQNQFRYIMVDEYQDTNMAQYELVSLLASKRGNLCVVGDEDQSIYRFRGATIENILSFEKQFSAKVIKLEQNYRSTETILEAANKVISRNTQRKSKSLWSELGQGDKIKVCTFSDEQGEAMFVAGEIMDKKGEGGSFSDNAILYRTNAQSRTAELALGRMSIPYKIVGGTKFYDRKEVKDILAYMSILDNPYDIVRLRRIVNTPKRNIGEAAQNEIERVSLGLGISPIEAMERADEYPTLQKKAKPLRQFVEIYNTIAESKGEGDVNLATLIDDIMDISGYRTMLQAEGDEGLTRLQNIDELKSSAMIFAEENEGAGLFEFLEQVALISDLDSYDQEDDKVVLMTMHSAKGLEFKNVFLIGAEENIFPSYRSMADPLEIEEERRLAYVAITRAKQNLYITHAKQRLLFGSTQRNRLSRFVGEIPISHIETIDKTAPVRGAGSGSASIAFSGTEGGYLQSQASKSVKIEKPQAGTALTFSNGDRVTHKVFGEGTVLGTTPMGNDTLLEIAFDKVGTKKIAAAFAKIEKV